MSDRMTSDYRRVQITGRGSYVISLPKKWVSDMGLSKGERVAIFRNSDGSLSLVTKEFERKGEAREIEFQVRRDTDAQSIMRRLVSLYLVGYNTIKITLKENRFSPVQRDTLREFVRKKLMGTEIVTESSNEILLQVLLSYPQLTAENALKRMTTIAEWMHKDAIQAFKEKSRDLAEEVAKMDDEVDRFGFYVVRQLKTALRDPQIIKELGLNSPIDCLGYRLVAKSVERAADHAVRISKNLVKGSVNKQMLERVQGISDFASLTFDTAMKSLYKRDYQMADVVLSKAGKIESLEAEAISEILKSRLAPEDISSLRLVVESLRRITEYGSDIAEVVLNLTVVETTENVSGLTS
jgi:phosphate uptake regulator